VTSPRPRAPRTGVVSDFDDPRGLGTVLADDGRRYPFHCTAISDGSRHIDVGAPVVFTLAAGHLGHLEARALLPTGSGGTGGQGAGD
jgi:cold shock CspA family protein